MSETYAEILARANQAVAKTAATLADDPQRPGYHLFTAANWINDPNGPCYYNGYWHMFFQHNPFIADFGPMGWGHVRSPDLVHWEHCPIALMPSPDSYDGAGCWSGSVVIHNGLPTMMYSGVADMTLWSADDDLPPSDRQRIPQGYYHEFVLEIDQETQCIATSKDNLQTWQKQSANPVIPAIPDGMDLIGFRDPFLWKEDDGLWYMLLGSGIKGQGGVALLYRSPDMINWEYLNPLTIGDPKESGINWECPNFLALGKKHMLVVSPHGRPVYWLGGIRRSSIYARWSTETPGLGGRLLRAQQPARPIRSLVDVGMDTRGAPTRSIRGGRLGILLDLAARNLVGCRWKSRRETGCGTPAIAESQVIRWRGIFGRSQSQLT